MNFAGSAPTRQPVIDSPEEVLPGEPGAVEAPESSENTVERFRILWGNRKLLFRASCYAMLASILLAFLIPARYESEVRVMPPDDSSTSGLVMAAAMTGGAGGLGTIANDLLGIKNNSDVFVGILGSHSAQDEIIRQFNLKKLYGDRRIEDARDDLAEHTVVSVDRKSEIITIKVTDKSPQRAAAISEAYLLELNSLVAQLSTSSARRERIFLEERLQDVSSGLETAEKDLSQFASKNAAIDIKEQGTAMVEAAAALQGQLIAAQTEYEGLRQTYSDNNVRVRTVKARIDELQRQLEKLGGKGESTTSVSDDPNGSMYPSIRKLPLLGVEYADLYRKTRIQEAVLEALTKEYEMAKVEEVKQVPKVKVLDQASVPEKKSFPPRTLIIFLGTTLGFAGAVTWVFGKTLWHQTDANDPRKVIVQEVLSTVSARVPAFSKKSSADHSFNGGIWSRMRGRTSKEHGESKQA